MALTIEQAQRVLDLRARMLSNVQDGKPAHEGLNPDEYRLCLDAVRGDRAKAAATAAAKKPRGGGKKKAESALETPQTSVANNPKFAKFLNKSFD